MHIDVFKTELKWICQSTLLTLEIRGSDESKLLLFSFAVSY